MEKEEKKALSIQNADEYAREPIKKIIDDMKYFSDKFPLYCLDAVSLVTIATFLTFLLSICAIRFLGVHEGYWLTSVLIAAATGVMLLKFFYEKVLPEVIGEERPISAVIYAFTASATAGAILMIFWGISVATGIAVQYDSLPFKI